MQWCDILLLGAGSIILRRFDAYIMMLQIEIFIHFFRKICWSCSFPYGSLEVRVFGSLNRLNLM